MDAIEQTVEAAGLNMHVLTMGEGPAVLLLHGFPDTHAVWRRQVGVLAAAGYRVIAPDLRGYGKTDAPAAVSAYAMAFLRNDVEALLDALGVDRVRLVGHDWGAMIGWQLCMHAPGRIERFVALSVGHPNAVAAAGLEQCVRSAYIALFELPGVAERLLRAGDWFLLRRQTRDPGQPGYWRRDLAPAGRLSAALNYYRANPKLFVPQRYPPVTMPVLGIWSDGDPALVEGQMKVSIRHVAGSFRYERITGADHWLQLTAPDRVNALLLDFFAAGPRLQG